MVRNITIINRVTNSTKDFKNVDVETLGSLKTFLTTNSIEVDNMSFKEGLSGVELLNDDSILPSNRMYQGKITNDLVILMDKKHKKLEFGSIEGDIENIDDKLYDLSRNVEDMDTKVENIVNYVEDIYKKVSALEENINSFISKHSKLKVTISTIEDEIEEDEEVIDILEGSETSTFDRDDLENMINKY